MGGTYDPDHTLHLRFRSDDEGTAVASIHALFSETRELMATNPDDAGFLLIAEKILNEAIRPSTARWHGWLTPDPKRKDKHGRSLLKFRDPQVRREFRRELRELQPRLLGYSKAFDLLRQGKKEIWMAGPWTIEFPEMRRFPTS